MLNKGLCIFLPACTYQETKSPNPRGLCIFIYLFIYLFIFNVYIYLRESETEIERGRGREMEAQSEAGPRLWAAEPGAGLKPTTSEVLSRSPMLNPLSHPGSSPTREGFLRHKALTFESTPWISLTFESTPKFYSVCYHLCLKLAMASVFLISIISSRSYKNVNKELNIFKEMSLCTYTYIQTYMGISFFYF